MLYGKEKHFSHSTAAIWVEEDTHLINFTVNNQWDWQDTPDKIAITRWLISELKSIKNEINLLVVTPYSGDNREDHRWSVFTKLGFFGDTNFLYWLSPDASEDERVALLSALDIDNFIHEDEDSCSSWVIKNEPMLGFLKATDLCCQLEDKPQERILRRRQRRQE